ncbi:MAG: hypothetical protein LBS14_02550 [Holosporaceae bacterium]|jgi:hypothetical protein|nr:hypothetical protein [Holosporaceae bacterium]
MKILAVVVLSMIMQHGGAMRQLVHIAYVQKGWLTFPRLRGSMESVVRDRERDGGYDLAFHVLYWDVDALDIQELIAWGGMRGVLVNCYRFDPALADDFPDDRRGRATVMKVFLADYVRGTTKVLCFDTDVIICSGGIRALWDFNLGNYPFAAVPMPFLSRRCLAMPWRKDFDATKTPCNFGEAVFVQNLTKREAILLARQEWKKIEVSFLHDSTEEAFCEHLSSGRLWPTALSSVVKEVTRAMEETFICFESVLCKLALMGLCAVLPPKFNVIINMSIIPYYGATETPKLPDYAAILVRRLAEDFLWRHYFFKDNATYLTWLAFGTGGPPVDDEAAEGVYSAFDVLMHGLLGGMSGVKAADFSARVRLIQEAIIEQNLDNQLHDDQLEALELAFVHGWPERLLTLPKKYRNPSRIVDVLRAEFVPIYALHQLLKKGHRTITRHPRFLQIAREAKTVSAEIIAFYSRPPLILHDEGMKKLIVDGQIFRAEHRELRRNPEVLQIAKLCDLPISRTPAGAPKLGKSALFRFLQSRGPILVEPRVIPWMRQLDPANYLNQLD